MSLFYTVKSYRELILFVPAKLCTGEKDSIASILYTHSSFGFSQYKAQHLTPRKHLMSVRL